MNATSLIANMLHSLGERMAGWLINDPASGQYKLAREVFTDKALFELEMRHIFEGNWIYLAHESQVAAPHDFLTAAIGRQPVLLTRQADGRIGCFVNVCQHRGARVCRERRGNQKLFTCGFHGWTYDGAGALVNVTEEKQGAYPGSFNRASLGLKPVARLESYRGFIFASLNPDVLPLTEYLAGARAFIDLFADQSESGYEVLRGATRYTYRGNWKLQAENGLDGYHVATVHANYVMTAQRRVAGESRNDTKVGDLSAIARRPGGFVAFDHGHAVLWFEYPNFRDRPNFEHYEHFQKKFGPQRTLWMCERFRNLLLFPNVFLMDQTSTQLRIIRPISVDETEIITYCIAPVGESSAARALRIRQYEDFFNASGMATPDDLTEFNNCQIGFNGRSAHWNEMSRGAARWIEGADAEGRDMGFDARLTGADTADEGLYISIHEDWLARMQKALAQELAAAK